MSIKANTTNNPFEHLRTPPLQDMVNSIDNIFRSVLLPPQHTFGALSIGGNIQSSNIPYNVVKQSETSYSIIFAVAGYSGHNLSINLEKDILVVQGKGYKETAEEAATYLHRGITNKDFRKAFDVSGLEIVNASHRDGLLVIDLKKIPSESSKKIPINSKEPPVYTKSVLTEGESS